MAQSLSWPRKAYTILTFLSFPCQNFWKNYEQCGASVTCRIRFKSIPFKCKTMAHLHWCLGYCSNTGLDVGRKVPMSSRARFKGSSLQSTSHKGTVSHLWRKDLFFLSGLWGFFVVMYLHLKHNSGFLKETDYTRENTSEFPLEVFVSCQHGYFKFELPIWIATKIHNFIKDPILFYGGKEGFVRRQVCFSIQFQCKGR